MSYSYRIPNASGGCKTPGRLNRSSWGPMTGTSIHRPDPPGTPEDYAELYQEHVLSTQNRQLYPLQEDLADWLNKTVGKCSFAINFLAPFLHIPRLQFTVSFIKTF